MNPNNMGDLLRQVTRMRKDMDRVQEELKNRYVEARAGGELVDVTFNGRQDLVKISLDPSLFKPGADGRVDSSLVEDLILAAVAQGMEKSKKLMKEEMEKVTGDLGLGGVLPGLLGI